MGQMENTKITEENNGGIGWKQHPYTLSIYQCLIDVLQKNENEALIYAEEFEAMYNQIYGPLKEKILANNIIDGSR